MYVGAIIVAWVSTGYVKNRAINRSLLNFNCLIVDTQCVTADWELKLLKTWLREILLSANNLSIQTK